MVCQLQCEQTRKKISFEPLSENSKSQPAFDTVDHAVLIERLIENVLHLVWVTVHCTG